MKNRYLYSAIIEDLSQKMIFIGGPRQVGKTTLAKIIAEKITKVSDYLNWDSPKDRKRIQKMEFLTDAELLVFDEIHKFKNWKNYLKGVFDTYKDKYKIIVTGSSRLDIYRRGGDSLQGRYYYYRLHPFSLNELNDVVQEKEIIPNQPLLFNQSSKTTILLYNQLLKFGGFPEPLLKQNDKILRRWHTNRIERLVKEDIRDVEYIKDISHLQILTDILPEKVGSLFSINSIREDLQVTHKSISNWLNILEHFYYIFRIYPYVNSKIKSLKKEPKLYLWDWSELTENIGAQFENFIASNLLKFCNYLIDAEGYKINLYYLRDIEGREVDFLVTYNNKPWIAVEAKKNYKQISNHLKYFMKKMKIPFAYQVVETANIDFCDKETNIRVISADKFLTGLL